MLGEDHNAVALAQAVGAGKLGSEVVGGLVEFGVGVSAVGVELLEGRLVRGVEGPLGDPVFGVHRAVGFWWRKVTVARLREPHPRPLSKREGSLTIGKEEIDKIKRTSC